MKNKKEKISFSVFIVCTLLITPLVSANYRSDPTADENTIFDDTSPIFVEAGGPYEANLGEVVNFQGYVIIDRVNITGYTWHFGDGRSYTATFDPDNISIVEGNISCPATHLYVRRGTFTASLTVNYDIIDSYSKYNLKKSANIKNTDTSIVTITLPYNDWGAYRETFVNTEEDFTKNVWDEEKGWSNTTELYEGDLIKFKIQFYAKQSYYNVKLVDRLPATVQFINATPAPDNINPEIYIDYEDNKIIPYTSLVWNIGDMWYGDTIDVEIIGRVEWLSKEYFNISSFYDEFSIVYHTRNYAQISGTRRSPGCGNRYPFSYGADVTFTIIPSNPEISIKKFVKKNCCGTYDDIGITVNKDERVTFWLKVTNTGVLPLENVNISDVLPIGLSYNDNARVDGVLHEPIFVDDYNFYWNIGSLDVGQIVNITFQASVVDCGVFTNVATVIGYYDGQKVLDSDTASVTVKCTPNVEIEKTIRKTECDPWVEHLDINLGDTVFFKLDVVNTGETVLDLVVSDVLPVNLEYINDTANYTPNVDGQNLTWFFKDVNPDEHIEIIFKAVATECGFGINWAYVFDRFQNVFDENNATIYIECEPNIDINVEKTVKRNCCGDYAKNIKIHFNDWVTFKIEVTNKADSAPLDIEVTDGLPNGFIYNDNAKVDGIAHEPDIITSSDGTILYTWVLYDVEPGQTVVITFEAIADECGRIINKVNVTGISEDERRIYAEDEASVFVLCPDIKIVKTADPTLINPGELVTYTYTVTNMGNTDLYNITLEDNQGVVPIYVSGDDGDGVLQINEIWTYIATANPIEDICNIGNVTAEDELGLQVSDENYTCVVVEECSCTSNISIDKKIFDGETWVDALLVEDYPLNVEFKITIKNIETCDLTDIVVNDMMNCGLENPTNFSITPDEINNRQITWILDDILSSSETITIIFNATVYINTSNEVLVTAVSTYDQTSVDANDIVTITKEETPETPILMYTPNSYNFGEKLKNQTIYTTIEIWNSGTGTLKYDLVENCSWLELSETNGTSIGEHDVITITVNTTGLACGAYSCNINIISNVGEATIIINVTVVEEQASPPTIIINKPVSGKLYFRDKEIKIFEFGLLNTLIIGPITISVDAESENATITKIEIYVDDIIKFNDTNSSIDFYWNEKIFGYHTIKVEVYDSLGLSAKEEITILIFNFGLVK